LGRVRLGSPESEDPKFNPAAGTAIILMVAEKRKRKMCPRTRYYTAPGLGRAFEISHPGVGATASIQFAPESSIQRFQVANRRFRVVDSTIPGCQSQIPSRRFVDSGLPIADSGGSRGLQPPDTEREFTGLQAWAPIVFRSSKAI
jgi:hypothetical protein